MIELERMTTEYVADEDRISLSANVKGGGTARLWLTRRIADRLVAALCKAVEPRHEDPVYAEIIGEIAQQRAEQRHQPQEPVKPAAPDHQWLIRKIDLRVPRGGASLVFTSAGGARARMTLSTELVRQWLAIVRRVYRAAEWPMTAWPEAMKAAPGGGKPPKVLH